jgi:tripartite-type tricarboxylate transporter receptor subunit TctC
MEVSVKPNVKGLALFAFLLGLSPGWAFGQEYPTKLIRIVAAFAAGSTTDVMARVVAGKLTEVLGQTVIVENRGGAGGNLGAQLVAKAAPDGYTLLMTGNAITVNVTLYKEPGFTMTDLVPVIMAGRTPNLIFAHPSLPSNNLQELIALAKTRPLSYASAGTGSGTQLMMEMLKRRTQTDILHVPFSPAAAVTAVVGDQVSISLLPLPQALPQVQAGKLKAIAVTTAKRVPSLPDVATVAESGIQGFEDASWFALFLPAGTPTPIVERLNSELNRAMNQPDVRAKLAALSIEFTRNSLTDVADEIRREVAKYANAIKETGAKAE